MRIFKSILVVVFSGMVLVTFSQSDTGEQSRGNLNEQYLDILENSKSYGAYKAVSTEKLTSFATSLKDSLGKYYQQRSMLNAEKYDLLNLNEQLEAQKENLEARLEQSESENNSINFLGMPVSKTMYNIIMWSLVALLTLSLVGTYVFLRQWYVEGKANQREAEKLNAELADLREKKLEKEIRLKRELQTALNKLDKVRNKPRSAQVN